MPRSQRSKIAATLVARQKTHGDFSANAEIMQDLKDLVRTHEGYENLSKVQREALDMVCHKVGRILCGNPNEPDHWHDIAGYASLAEERCTG